MTTQKLSSEKLIDFSLFKNITRRRLSHILLAFLMNFFTISVSVMMVFDNYGDMLERYGKDYVISRAVNDMEGIMVLNLVFSIFFAIYLGIVTLSYMMKRRSAHFYHALPQKRETLYLTNVVSALVCAAIGAVINLVIATVELCVFQVAYKEVIAIFATLLFKNVVFFLAIYAITVFAGSFSGNGVVQFLMTLVITLYPLATYSGLIAMRELYADYFYPEFYFNESLQWISPFAYIIVNYLSEIKIFPTVISLLATAALILGGLVIYKKRAIENSERPIVFKKLGNVLKYMLMFTITMFSGMFFYAIGYSIFHIIFGFVCGAVLSFMLFNTILEKSPKAMFSGAKGLAIFLAAFAVYALVGCFDVLNIDEYVPSENNIAYANIDINGIEYDDSHFDDENTLSALSNLLEAQRDNNRKGVVYPVTENSYSFTVNAVMYTKLGIPIARTYRISKFTEGAQDFLKLYADDERMYDAYLKEMSEYLEFIENGYDAAYYINYKGNDRVEGDIERLLKIYTSEFGVANYGRLSTPSVGSIYIYNFYNTLATYSMRDYNNVNRIFSELPIYSDMTKTIEYIESLKVENESYEKVEAVEITQTTDYNETKTVGRIFDTRKLAENGNKNYVKNHLAGNLYEYPYLEISDGLKDELVNKLGDIKNSSSLLSRTFVAIDTDYVFVVIYPEKDEALYRNTYVFPRGFVTDEIRAMFK